MNKDNSNSCGCSSGQPTGCASTKVDTESTVFHVSNMDCRNEEALVRRTLEGMPGVQRLEFNLPQRKLTISHTQGSPDALEQALNAVGMKAQLVRDAAVLTTYRIENMDCPSEEKLIRSHLGAVEGVQDLEFDLSGRTLSVKHLTQARAQMEVVLASIGMQAKEQIAAGTGLAAVPAVEPLIAQPQPPVTATTTSAGERVTYRIENMDCPTEEALIRDRLGKEPGVTALDFNLMQRVLGVQHTLPSMEPVEKALASIGMRAVREGLQGATTVLRIAKMDCPTEESLIRGKLQGMPGVQGLDFNLMQRTLTVRHTPDALKPAVEAIESLGMEAEVQKTEESRDSEAPAHKTNWWPMAVSGITAVLAEGVYWANDGFHWAVVVLALVSIFTGGLSTYKKGWIALKNLNLNMNALMSIAVTGAMAIGHWPEAAMVMFLFALAEVIEAKSLDRARNAIRGLMNLAPETATVRQADGSWKEIPAKEAAKGAVVRVRPGERIALDGLITAGRSAINQAPITGESLPVEKAEGDQVFAGTINETGSFEYQVTAGANDSTLARIIHAVESAQGSRAPTQRFVDQFARVYTPAVFAVAVLVAVVPPLAFGGAWFDWIYRALVLLVVACPCALVISTPVTIVSGLAAAARRGILIKGGVYLEGGRKLKVLALDKTGTLTHGKPEQTDFVPLVGDAQEVAAWAASLAARSDHPVSQAIARKANRDGIALHEVDDFAALPGRGVRGRIAGRVLNMGNHRLAQELGLSETSLQSRLETLERQGKTAILLMNESTVLGIFAVADTVKETSREAVADLQALGVRTLMLTGDNQHTAAAIAAQVGISEARGDQLPEDKLKTVESLIGVEGQVGMVGDGINDSPALARADIGFAMGAAGTDTAIETADVALMDDDLRKIPAFIRLSRTTASILTQNIVLALGIKAVSVACMWCQAVFCFSSRRPLKTTSRLAPMSANTAIHIVACPVNVSATNTATQGIQHWLYDWGGANVDLFLAIQRTLPDGWIWLPEILTALGSYWGAPAVVVLLLVWRRVKVAGSVSLTVSLYQFVLGLALAIATAALAKALLALPRPFVVLGDAVYRATSAPDSRYTMPSGHSVYVGVLVAALWPVLGWSGRIGLLVFAAAVGWSRIVLGAHFPVDVIAGFALGWACVAVVGPWARRVARSLPLAGAAR